MSPSSIKYRQPTVNHTNGRNISGKVKKPNANRLVKIDTRNRIFTFFAQSNIRIAPEGTHYLPVGNIIDMILSKCLVGVSQPKEMKIQLHPHLNRKKKLKSPTFVINPNNNTIVNMAMPIENVCTIPTVICKGERLIQVRLDRETNTHKKYVVD